MKLSTLLIASCLFLLGSAQSSTKHLINYNDFMNETQKLSTDNDRMRLVWWLPKEFWQASAQNDNSINDEQVKELEKMFNDYTVLIAVDGEIGTFGNVSYVSEEDIRSNILIKDESGSIYKPMSDSKIPSDLKGFITIFKPALANMLGSMGNNIQVYVFQNRNNEAVLNATSKGNFTVKLFTENFIFKLPLPSVLPEKTCGSCNEKLKGTFNYCPYDGTKL